MRRLLTLQEIDLHIVAVMVIVIPFVILNWCLGWLTIHDSSFDGLFTSTQHLSWWFLLVPALFPQGMIYTRAVRDGKLLRAHVATNELLVMVVVGLLGAIRCLIGQTL